MVYANMFLILNRTKTKKPEPEQDKKVSYL